MIAISSSPSSSFRWRQLHQFSLDWSLRSAPGNTQKGEMSRSLSLLLISSLVLSISAQGPSSTAAATMSAYDALRSHGLPIGLLPEGVEEFNVDEAGQFRLRIDRPCTATFETEVHYDAEVSGIFSYGQIASLSGVSAQELFLWFPVREIRVDVPSSGLIYFDVGVIYKQFSLSLFETPPDCVPAEIPDPQAIRDGAHIARLVAESQSRKLRYELDSQEGDDGERAVI